MKPPFFQHPQALVESDDIGSGTRIWAFAHVLKGARIGRDCNVGDHAFLEGGSVVGHRVTLKNGVAVWSGVTIADDVFVGPNAVFTNDLFPRSPRFEQAQARYADARNWLVPTHVGRGSSIGANATIRCGIRIGEFAMVGAGSVVTHDVPAHALVLGVPGEIRGWVCRCGQKLVLDPAARATCQPCKLRYKLTEGILRRVR